MTNEARPERTINMLSDAGTPLYFTVLDDCTDEQALIDAGAFASRMGNTKAVFVSLVPKEAS